MKTFILKLCLLLIIMFSTSYLSTGYGMNMPNNIVPLVTPCNHGMVDADSLDKLVRFQISNHITAVFLLGTTGEFNNMSMANKKALIDSFYKLRTNIEEPIFSLVGVSANKPAETLELIKYVTEKNYAVDAFVIAPLFGEGDPEAKVKLVLQHTNKPVMLYNNPAVHNGKILPLSLVKKFVGNPRIIGIKDSSNDRVYFTSLLNLATSKFHVYQGAPEGFFDSLKDPRLSGIVPGIANIIPSTYYNLMKGIDREAAQSDALTMKNKLDQYASRIAGIKALLYKQGILASTETCNALSSTGK